MPKARKFYRRNWDRYSRLGKTRKKLRSWRRPKGRHSKTREKMKGYPMPVEIGHAKDKKVRGKIQEKNPVIIYNANELNNIKKHEIVIIGKVGKRKKIEIAQKAKEMKISVFNVNLKKLMKTANKKTEEMKKTTETKVKETKK